ncbi:MAG TPA: Do family serine endopeptidase [Polyangiaceae bacterium]|nr:Do family serine endopeptidase [Polyangiaceae bacterium]
MLKLSYGFVSVLALAFAASGCARGTALSKSEVKPEPGHSSDVTVMAHPALTQVGGSVSIADVAERVLPSVVTVSTTVVQRQQMGMFPFFGGPSERQAQGIGSGVIVSTDGYILTNNHVVAEAKEIKVTLADKREYDATVVGTDPKSDLAVIKVKGSPTGLIAAEFGDSSKLRLGDVVLAIGNPLGVGETVTMGIVSAKGRADLGITAYEDFIQTDAAINPGNSGGALINTEGKLVGINTAILSRTGGYQGIGLAIPSSMAQPIMETLKQNGKVSRGFLGVGIQDVDRDLAVALKLPSPNGVLLTEVRGGGPGSKAGLSRGDVVTKVDGRAVTSTGQFRNLIASSGAKKKVALEVMRDGKPIAFNVELGEVPDEAGEAQLGGSGGSPKATSGGALDGVSLEELTPEHRRTLGLGPDVQHGVVITDLEPRSGAAKAGLRPGDVLLELNRVPIESLAKFKDLYSKASGDVLLLVQRRGGTVFLVVRK